MFRAEGKAEREAEGDFTEFYLSPFPRSRLSQFRPALASRELS
jgi:hypothetical protein